MRERLAVPLTVSVLLAAAALPAQAGMQQPADDTIRRILRDAVAEADSFADRFDAEVWLVDMSRRLSEKVPDPTERLQILKNVHREAARVDLPPELVLAIIEVESNFDRFAISDAGARGLMQVMPFWLEEIGHPEDNLFHVHTNLRFGCTILRYYIDLERGDWKKGLARYNGSVGQTWYSNRVLNALSRRWFRR